LVYEEINLPLSEEVQQMYNRAIDTFTDATFRESTKKLHPRYHYVGVIVDVFYDHFWQKIEFLILMKI
jgi:acyl carrier protein phosphodiesterase